MIRCNGIFFYLLLPFLFVFQCTHQVSSPTIPFPIEHQYETELNNDASDLSTRISLKEISEMPVYDLMQNNDIMVDDVADDSFLFLSCAEIDPPKLNGDLMKINSIKIHGDYAMISYCSDVDFYFSKLITVYLINPKIPVIISQVTLPNRRVRCFDFSNDAVFLIESMNLNYFTNLNYPNAIEKIMLKDFLFTSETEIGEYRYGPIDDILLFEENVYVSSNEIGGMQIIDYENLNVVSQISLDHPNSLNQYKNEVVVIQESPLRLSFLNTIQPGFYNTRIFNKSQPFEPITHIVIENDFVAVPFQERGVEVLNLFDGSIAQVIDAQELPIGALSQLYNTRDIASNQDMIFMANGMGGLTIVQNYNYEQNLYERLGSLEFNNSVEYVASYEEILLVGSLNNKIHVLETKQYLPEPSNYQTLCIWDETGLPDKLCLNDLNLTNDFLKRLNQFLPEKVNINTFHSTMINAPLEAIALTEAGDVWISFIAENTGWKNSIGFYSYPTHYKPILLDQILNMTIAFPNVSLVGNGGKLHQGNRVYLGHFEANTSIGFFLISQGWNNGQVTNGLYRHLTNYQFNPEKNNALKPHHLFFYDTEKELIILTFEEMSRETANCDHDYNDVILGIDVEPHASVQVESLPRFEF